MIPTMAIGINVSLPLGERHILIPIVVDHPGLHRLVVTIELPPVSDSQFNAA